MGDREDSVAVVAVSLPGCEVARRLGALLPGARLFLPARYVTDTSESTRCWDGSLAALMSGLFPACSRIVVIGSVGMVVRLIAPLVKDKRSDPAVVVVDDASRFAVSLLSGHIGGANDLARQVGSLLGAEPVVTTASDVLGTVAADLLGREFGWRLETTADLTRVSGAIVGGESVGVYQDAGEPHWWPEGAPLPANIIEVAAIAELRPPRFAAALIVTDRALPLGSVPPIPHVVYRPRTLVAGIGCNRGTDAGEIGDLLRLTLEGAGMSSSSLACLASTDLKRDEEGLLRLGEELSLPVRFFPAERLAKVDVPNPSEAALRWAGSPGVAEAAALLAAGGGELIVPKVKSGNVTVAIARKASGIESCW